MQWRRIVDAAEALFLTKGFEHTTMDEIAKDAGCGRSTIYLLFKGKRQIYHGVALRAYERFGDSLQRALQNGNPVNGLEKLVILRKGFVHFLESDAKCFGLVAHFEAVTRDGFETGRVWLECCYERERLINMIGAAVREGVNDGSLKPDLDVVDTALILWSSFLGVANVFHNKQTLLQNTYKRTVLQLAEAMLVFASRTLKSEPGSEKRTERG